MGRHPLIAGILLGLALALPPGALGAPVTEERRYPDGYRAVAVTPSTAPAGVPVPLLVLLHGCNSTAERALGSTLLGEEAERRGFVVLSVDLDPATHPKRCWRFWADRRRDDPDPAAVAAMTRDAMARRPIDPQRVYAVGASSGAMMTAVLGATHPDLFAAIAMDAGCAYRAVTCIHRGPSRPTARLARAAWRAMGEHERVVPALVLHGDRDRVVPFSHSRQVTDQWRMTNDLVGDGRADGDVTKRPAQRRSVRSAGGRRSVVERHEDREGCLVVERWTVRGMGHFWPGGPGDPSWRRFTDPRGPSGAGLVWRFLRRFTKATTSAPCAEARGA